jgi:hypothetical protein
MLIDGAAQLALFFLILGDLCCDIEGKCFAVLAFRYVLAEGGDIVVGKG